MGVQPLQAVNLSDLFAHPKPLIGMVHLLPLPGSAGYRGDMDTAIKRALADVAALEGAGFDGAIVENFGDVPYRVGSNQTESRVAMARIVCEVSHVCSIPLGVNVQFNDYEAELAIARFCGASFFRVEVFVDNVATPGGFCPACAPELSRLRAASGGAPPYIFADIHVKETTLIAPTTLEVSAKNAETAGADALIVTGSGTGEATPLDDVRRVKQASVLPVLVGSGLTVATAPQVLAVADGAIVGSSTKVGGIVTNPVDPVAAALMVRAARG